MIPFRRVHNEHDGTLYSGCNTPVPVGAEPHKHRIAFLSIFSHWMAARNGINSLVVSGAFTRPSTTAWSRKCKNKKKEPKTKSKSLSRWPGSAMWNYSEEKSVSCSIWNVWPNKYQTSSFSTKWVFTQMALAIAGSVRRMLCSEWARNFKQIVCSQK